MMISSVPIRCDIIPHPDIGWLAKFDNEALDMGGVQHLFVLLGTEDLLEAILNKDFPCSTHR